MKRFIDRLRELGYEKPRAALALLALAFFGIVYLLVGLNSPPGWGPAFVALSACYLTAFVGLASECFWSRWFASGLGWSGTMVGLISLVMAGWQPALAVYAALHGLVVLMLSGPKMAARYDLQVGWRERFSMDEFGVQRVRKAVTRGSAALPSLIIWALAPKDGAAMGVAVALAAVLAVFGLGALVRFRSWGVLALAGSLAAAVAAPLLGVTLGEHVQLYGTGPFAWWAIAAVLCVFVWLPGALLPLAGPTVRFLRSEPPRR